MNNINSRGLTADDEPIICEACGNEFKENNVRYISVTNKYNQEISGNICDDCLYEALEEILAEV